MNEAPRLGPDLVRFVATVVVGITSPDSRTRAAFTAGPLPLVLPDGGRADAAARGSYFFARVHGSLYGAGRLHLARHLGDRDAPLAVHAVELLLPQDPGVRASFAILHFEANPGADAQTVPVDACLTELERLVRPGLPESRTDALLSQVGLARDPNVRGRAKSLALLTTNEDPSVGGTPVDTTRDARHLWMVASATTEARYPPSRSTLADIEHTGLELSADWRALVLRDGWGFVGTRADRGDADPFFGYAAAYLRSVYLDAFLLGEQARASLDHLVDAVAELADPINDDLGRSVLEGRLTRFRHQTWWTKVTPHETAESLLEAYHRQHRLAASLEGIETDLASYARRAEAAAAQRVGALLTLLTILALPVGLAGPVLDITGLRGASGLLVVVAVIVATLLATLSTRPGRRLLRPLVRVRE